MFYHKGKFAQLKVPMGHKNVIPFSLNMQNICLVFHL